MQQLQANLAAVVMHGCGHLPMPAHMPRHRHAAGEGLEPATDIRGKTAGHHQPHAALGAFGKIRRQLGEVGNAVFQPGVHRAHQHAIAQSGEAQIEWGQEVRVGRCHVCSIPMRTVGCMGAIHIHLV